jgi:hypothetical protein
MSWPIFLQSHGNMSSCSEDCESFVPEGQVA